MAQVKSVKDSTGMEIGFANPIVAAGVPWAGFGSKGALRQNGPTRILEIADGTSNTTLYSEIAGRSQQCYKGGKCVSYDATSMSGMIWADSDNRVTVTGTSADGLSAFGTGPCGLNCNNMQGDIYSFHTGGANVVFADGSVRFLRDTITLPTLAAIVTKAGGEIVSLE